MTLRWVLLILAAYLIGSIPFGVLIGRAKGINIREHGSKNIGATNVGRVLGRRLGVACFLLDFLKGAAPVLIAGFACGVIGREPHPGESPAWMWLWLAVAVAAIIGHMAPMFARFVGGKGVATTFGAMLAMWQLLTFPAIGALAVWYVALRVTRYVSVASMLGTLSLPVWYLIRIIPPSGENVLAKILHASPPLIVTGVLALLVIWRHRGNIARIRRGEEPKAGAAAQRGDLLKTGDDA